MVVALLFIPPKQNGKGEGAIFKTFRQFYLALLIYFYGRQVVVSNRKFSDVLQVVLNSSISIDINEKCFSHNSIAISG